MNNTLGMIGLMRRAKAIEIGETNTGSAAHAHKARLILLASDASENARKRAETFAFSGNTEMITIPFTKAEIAGASGLSGCSMAAVLDLGFAVALLKQLKERDPEAFSGICERYEKKLSSLKRGKSSK